MSKIGNKFLTHANANIALSRDEKDEIIQNAAIKYGEFMDALKIDWRNDPNSTNTPTRVAKSFVNDLMSGCYAEPPSTTSFPSNGYTGIVFEGNIPLTSMCAHHHLAFTGVVHVAYIPNKFVAGLSKLNRIVDYYGKRPNIQEELTMQIHNAVNTMCKGNKGVAVSVSASHTCVSCRGVRHQGCSMKTSKLSGDFMKDDATRAEFYHFISDL